MFREKQSRPETPAMEDVPEEEIPKYMLEIQDHLSYFPFDRDVHEHLHILQFPYHNNELWYKDCLQIKITKIMSSFSIMHQRNKDMQCYLKTNGLWSYSTCSPVVEFLHLDAEKQ